MPDDDDLPASLERSIERLLEIPLVARAELAVASELLARIERVTERLIGLRLATTPPVASPRAREGVP